MRKLLSSLLIIMLIGCASANLPVKQEKPEEPKNLRTIEVIFQNNSQTRTAYYDLEWLNSGFGCYTIPMTGMVKCEYPVAGGELKPGKSHTFVMKGNHAKNGMKYKIEWNFVGEPVISIEEFEITEDLKKIILQPLNADQGV